MYMLAVKSIQILHWIHTSIYLLEAKKVVILGTSSQDREA